MNSKPLSGKTILVTRPATQSAELSVPLEAAGAETICIPLIRIAEPKSWEAFDAAAKQLDSYTWIIFASANAVNASMQRLQKLRVALNPARTKVACIGTATAKSLAVYGVECNYSPDKFIAESFIEHFPHTDSPNAKILWTKTNIGRMLIKEELESSGWQVDVVESYNTLAPEDLLETGTSIRRLLERNNIDAITLSSSETARNLKAALEAAHADIAASLTNTKLIVIGSSTEKTCLELFNRCDFCAKTFNKDGMIEAVIKALS